MPRSLSFAVQQFDGALALLTVTGEIDFTTAPELRDRALELSRQGNLHLILDLAPVAFCDSSGLNALIGILRCTKETGGSLALAAVPDRLARLLDLTGVSRLLPAHADAAAAMSAHGAAHGAAADPPSGRHLRAVAAPQEGP
ncbi:STAS domain-containing protein [Streptomyces chryseus]|uniref:STAS domain-containing protein n=1 Tax=Streptomyces chryseus TaxID=68186 RepID=UPI00110FF199|nr:STAS domain-containing protein [Streptomyces chryseus]